MTGYYQPYWIDTDSKLEHFGIKGMKWGIRRYQNPDGTLTDAGKKRYGTVESLNLAKERSAARKKMAVKVAKTSIKVAAIVGLGMLSKTLMASAVSDALGGSAARAGTKAVGSLLSVCGKTAIDEISIPEDAIPEKFVREKRV